MKSKPVIGLMLAALDEAFDRKSWHGTNLSGSLRSVTIDLAAWRPGKERHNIWEVVVHAAYWKYIVRRAITGEKRRSFLYKGSNWFRRDQADVAQWRSDLELLTGEHRQLREAITGFDSRRLSDVAGKKFTYDGLIRGVAAHDLYHAGQIQLLKRLRSTL
jgi:hypothetical protein